MVRVERANAVAAIDEDEAARGTRRAVAGFDYTFSIPKSASVLWAVADAGTQALTAACPAMTELASLAHQFTELLTPTTGNDTALTAWITAWITAVRAADLPSLHAFANGLELDRAAVNAGLCLPHHNGRTEGVNTRTKRIMRQMHGRAGFALLRHRILIT